MCMNVCVCVRGGVGVHEQRVCVRGEGVDRMG